MVSGIQVWDDEGGAPTCTAEASAPVLIGTAGQVEWAERIRRLVEVEFDRVAASFRRVASKQTGDKRAGTETILAILEEKRADAIGRTQAGYFIHDWQEIGDQVRQMIFLDDRYKKIQAARGRSDSGTQAAIVTSNPAQET